MDLKQIFDGLTLETIERFVAERQEEHLSLDFKTGGQELTSGDDKRNLAELLSGFSNSAGGIVVWGVATRKDSAGRDVAVELKPLANIIRFVTRLDEFTPLLVVPINASVTHRAFERSDGSGYAATFVPETDSGPHMALGGHDRFFKRAGDRFYRMEQFDVSDMFGRRRRGSLAIGVAVSAGSSSHGPGGTKRTVQILIELQNHGRASLAAPFLRLHTSAPYQVRIHGASSRSNGDALFESLPGPGHHLWLIAGANVLLHPKMALPVAAVTAELWDYESIQPCKISFSHAALDLPLTEGDLDVDAETVARVVNRGAA
jgi:hypothetical protein